MDAKPLIAISTLIFLTPAFANPAQEALDGYYNPVNQPNNELLNRAPTIDVPNVARERPPKNAWTSPDGPWSTDSSGATCLVQPVGTSKTQHPNTCQF